MKKITALFIALFILSLSAPVFAGPFSDVKPGHWAYEAIKSLSSKGILEGYPDGTFKGGKALSRYEAAQMVARLIERGGVGDYETLQKLTIEFADELALLGVKVTALEDEMKVLRSEMDSKLDGFGMGKIKVTAETRMRYETGKYDFNNGLIGGAVVADSANNSTLRFRLNMAAKIDDNVSGYFSFQDDALMGAAKQNNQAFGAQVPAALNRNLFLGYVDVKNFGGYLDNVRFGRQTFTLGKGFLHDAEVDGILAKKTYHGTVWQFAAFEIDDVIAAAANDGMNTKLVTVDHAWKRIAAGAYFMGVDRAEGPVAGIPFYGIGPCPVGNLKIAGLTIDAKLGKDVVGYIEAAQLKNDGYKDTVTGTGLGLVNQKEKGTGMKLGVEWQINKYYDLSVLYQDRGKDFYVLNHNDDYSDSYFYGNAPFLPLLTKVNGAAAQSFSNSKIMSVIFGSKLRNDLQLDLWYEALKGKDDLNVLVGKQTGNIDQTVAQAVVTYQYRDNTAFKLRYRAVKFDDGDQDITAAQKAAGTYPADYNQLRLDMNVKF